MLKDIELLNGFDYEENIVAIENVPNTNLVQIFKRVDGELTSRIEKFKPFYLVNEKENIGSVMFGSNYYNRYVECDSYEHLREQRFKHKDIFVPFQNAQYYVKTGKTLFKGNTEPLIFYFDLEVMTSEGYDFPNPKRNEDEIIIISCLDSRGNGRIFVNNKDKKTNKGEKVELCDDEKDLLQKFISYFRLVDPDIIANHNIFNFDLNYLYQRCELLGVALLLGRNGSEPLINDSSIKFGDRNRNYTNYKIFGRHVIDTQFLAESADVTSRDMPNYGLKDLVKYLGKAKEDREYVDGADIKNVWFSDRDRLIRYALDDVYEAEILYKHYSPAVYTQTQLVPMSYQDVFRYGTGNMIDYIMLRNYIYYNWSFPKPNKQRHIKGGYADVLKYGLIKDDLIYADVESLYPSLAVFLKIQPKKDELHLFQKLVRMMIDLRFSIKREIKKYKEQGKDELAAKQKAYDSALKIFLNTLSYGYLAWSFGAFNDYDEAERITEGGQNIVKKMIECILSDGAEVIKVDTDGLCCTLPEKYKGSFDSEMEYINTLTARMPEGIRIGHDGRYKAMLAFDKKSYALLDYNDKITVKGNTIRGRNVEPFGAEFLKNCIYELLIGDPKKCSDYYEQTLLKILQKKLEPNEIFSRSSLGESLEEYKNKKESGNPPRASYELALQKEGMYEKGDVIYYYIKEKPLKVELKRNKLVAKREKLPAYQSCDFLSNYNYDYDVDHYLDRFTKITKKFLVLGEDMFTQLFPDITIKAADRRKIEKLNGEEDNED